MSGRRYDLSAFEQIVVLGAGKASAELAVGLEKLLGTRLGGGLVVVRRRPAVAPLRVSIVEAGHPSPPLPASTPAGHLSRRGQG